jgi:dipeptidyl aminopeptidase/acylaminoacyl peptidase
MKKTQVLLRALTFVALLLAPAAAYPQSYGFGKNKVQYQSFNWLTLHGEHVEIFYYPEEEPLARAALTFAEESYRDLAIKFQHEVDRPIPMIVYSSHHHFEQTNVSPFFLPEGVQGFTEFSKGRVVLPYTGSYAEFHHVIRHEMVHVFQFSLIEQVYKEHRKATYVVPPLWFSEGLAEYWSTPWDAQGTMVLSDMVLESKLPPINDLWRYNGTFTVYKLGQSLCEFIGTNYGDDALRRLYSEIYKEDRFERLLARVTGVSANRLSEDWIYAMKRRYFPEVKDRVTLSLGADERAVSQGVNLKPVAVPDSTLLGGNRYLFLSARSGYTNIYSASTLGRERDVRSVVRGQRAAQFESFHPFQSRIDVSIRGELAFVSKWDDRDALFVMDLATKKIKVRTHLDGLIALSSPAWSRDGKRIALSGITPAGQSDLYLFDPETLAVRRLTNDYYTDSDPTWSPDGRTLAFSSDRTRYGKEGHSNLFVIDTETLAVRYLTCGPWIDQSPAWSPDGSRIAFSSDRAGSFDLYTVDAAGNGGRLRHLLGAAMDPAWLPDGKGLLFTGFRRGGFGVYHMRADSAATDSFALAATDGPGQWGWDDALAASKEPPTRYEPRYGLDLVQGGIAVDPGDNPAEGLQGTVSDLLGNRLYHFQVGNTAETTSDILSRMNLGLWFINLQHRWNYGVGAFHFAGDYEDAIGLRYFERRAGGSLLASYPFSRFRRIEGTVQAYYDEKEREDGTLRRGFLTTHALSLVRDNTLWFPTGPRDGSRYNLTGSVTTNWNHGRTENVTLSADVRRYFRTSQWTTLAVRLQSRYSAGDDPQRFAMGGTHSLRGYGRRSIYGTRLYLANAEYRFPLFDHVVLGVPLRSLELPSIEGAVFADAGNAWEKFESLPRPKGSFGIGLRTSLGGYFVLRYDLARRTDFKEVQPGWEREFYLGFDY